MSGQQVTAGSGQLERLTRRFWVVCESAVDPLEVASALEFDGVSDRAAREDYDVADVFTLGRMLYDRVPRWPAPPEAEPDPWRTSRALVHGLLYALPAVFFPAAGELLDGPRVITALLTALVAGWGLSQGLAAVGYLRLGMSGPDGARRVLRWSLACCLVAVALIMAAVMLATRARPPVVIFGAGEAVYMLGACVLLVLGAERWLPAALAPGVTAATVYLILGKPPSLDHQTWAAMAATPLFVCVIAGAVTATAGSRSAGVGRREGGGRLPSRGERRGALPAVALGVIAAGLLSFPVVAGVSGHGGGNPGAIVASVPLALSMGVAEWSLLWYRRAARRLLSVTDDPRWFRVHARLRLLGALTRYVLGAAMLVGAALAVAVRTGQVRLDSTVLLAIAGYLLLGAAMFLVMLLQTMLVRLLPLALAAAGLAAELTLREHGLAVQLAVPAFLLVTVGGYALARVGETVRHL
jgi:hypothetical protein